MAQRCNPQKSPGLYGSSLAGLAFGRESGAIVLQRAAAAQAHAEQLFELKNLPAAGRAYVLETMVGSPTRRHRTVMDSVIVRHPSPKMGPVTLMGRTGEHAAALGYDKREDVLGYYPQPMPRYLVVKNEDESVSTKVWNTADFFLLCANDFLVTEIRDEAYLVERMLKNPYQFYKDSDRRWHYRAAEESYASIGLRYEITTNQSLPARLLENEVFLRDYCREDCPPLLEVTVKRLGLAVERLRFAGFRTLLAEGFESDDIFKAIVCGTVYVDLERVALHRPSDLFVYPNAELYGAHQVIEGFNNEEVSPLGGTAKIAPGTEILLNGSKYTVVLPGEVDIQVIDEHGVQSTWPLGSILDQNGKVIHLVNAPNTTASRSLSAHTPTEITEAVRRLNAIDAKAAKNEPLSRTERYWRAAIRAAGTGRIDQVVACIDRNRCKGNRQPRLDPATEALAKEALDTIYNTAERRTARQVYKDYVAKCETHSIATGTVVDAMSYKAFCRRVREHEDIRKREGKRKAYQLSAINTSLNNAFPVHGVRPHEVCYIDSTLVNLQTVSPEGVPLKKFWLTAGVDGCTHQSRCLICTYDPPGRWTVLQAIRDYVRRHRRLPDAISVDCGSENDNRDVKHSCDVYGIKFILRKPAEPRGGAMIESMLGATEKSVIQYLKGNTTNMKDPRLVTASVNGFNRGTWTLYAAYHALQEYLFTERNATTHVLLGASPNEFEAIKLRETGMRIHTAVAFDSNLMLMTSPHPKGWTRVYSQVKGVNVGGRLFRAPEMAGLRNGTELEVRVEPWLARVIYVLIDKKWCIATCSHQALANHTRREDEMALRALAKQGGALRYLEGKQRPPSAYLESPAIYDQELETKQNETKRLYAALGMTYALPEVQKLAEDRDNWLKTLLAVPAVPDPDASTGDAKTDCPPQLDSELPESSILAGVRGYRGAHVLDTGAKHVDSS